jgi:prepilin-type processing-associated H-X9-DG protein
MDECDVVGKMYILGYPGSYTYFPYATEDATQFITYFSAYSSVLFSTLMGEILVSVPYNCAFNGGPSATLTVDPWPLDADLNASYMNSLVGSSAGWDMATAAMGRVKGGDYSGYTLYRLREGIERFFITDINNPAGSSKAQSDLAVMWDHWSTNRSDYVAASEGPMTIASYNHVPGGCNVLYMDGHVEFIRQGTEYPVPSSAGAGQLPQSFFDGINTWPYAAMAMAWAQSFMGGNVDFN